ncbi:MAG: hypothetical protein ACK5L3_02210 [Oscillospiraceae bacterium]
MKIGLTYDLREDYGIKHNSEIFADFCHPDEIAYLARAIQAGGHEVVMLGNMYRLNEAIKAGTFACDLVFVEDEGIASRNREAIVPALLELNRIPYVGSDAYAMGLSQNKFHTKLAARALGIPVPAEIYVNCGQKDLPGFLAAEMKRLHISFPLVVKPNCEGYSMGVFLVRDLAGAVEKIHFNFEHYRQEVLCEEYIEGPELYVPLIGTGAESLCLGVGRCSYPDGRDFEIFSLRDKCFSPLKDTIADVTEEMRGRLFQWSLAIHRHLGCADFSRSDFRINKDGRAYFLEVNPRPGLTENGPYETCGKAIGLEYADVVARIIESAVKRYPQLQRL